MASPGPDTSVLDPKPPDTLLDKEHKSELNGHAPVSMPAHVSVPTVEKSTEPPSESKLDSPLQSKDEPQDKPKESLLNGDSKTEGHAGANGVATDDVDMRNAEPEIQESRGAELESSRLDDVKESQPEPESTAEEVKEVPAIAEVPTTEVNSTSDRPADEPAAVAPDDVEMVDATNAEAAPTEPTPSATVLDATPEQPAVKETSFAEESKSDTDMAEQPLEEPADAEKPTDADDSVPPSEDPIPTSEVDLGPSGLSQLAIETTEGDIKSADVSIEVSMADAPNSKVAREREDDGGDEPAPKRAKTEPKEEEPSVATPTDATASDTISVKGPTHLEPSSLATLAQWDDAEKSTKVITAYQRREMRKVIGRIKKTKHGNSFRDSVEKLWPQIWEGYTAKIEKPMDLSEIDRSLRDGAYTTFGDFKDNLKLIFLNTLAFNGPVHDITGYALGAIKTTWEDVRRIPEEEPAKPKAVPKSKPLRESRAVANANVTVSTDAATRRQSAGPTASPARDVPETKPQPAAAQPANLRRASTATEGDRPKRTVRAPKPKDIDYSTKASRKKLKPELQFCEEVLTELTHPKNVNLNQWFMDPVDAEGLGIPHYYSMIKKPMDLNKVIRMLSSGEISSLKDFDKNVRLVFTNCYDFNGTPDQGNPVSLLAKQLEDIYNTQMKGKDAWLSKHAKANARQASASNASDEEDEDGDDEDDAGGSLGVDPSKEVKELEAKYHEETQKLNSIILADSPIQSMIDIQQGILKVVQEALLKAKLALAEYRQKQEKGGKKGGNKKTKASGAVARKSGGSAAQPKKATGSKKATKKALTPADKDQIANAINDLEGGHLDRAIDIIKRDTGQNENNDGELELDIDQLSNEALLKLWELCKKVLPGFGKDSAANTKSSPEVNRTAPPKQASNNNAAKPKKNKPMSAQEQEARIAQLQSLSNLYKPGQENSEGLAMALEEMAPVDSSDESSSEEE